MRILLIVLFLFVPFEKDPYTITGYCSCERCCGKTDGITASGAKVKTGIVAHRSLPFGTKVFIEGQGVYEVTDRGNLKENQFDMYFNSHNEAKTFGKKICRVKIIRSKK